MELLLEFLGFLLCLAFLGGLVYFPIKGNLDTAKKIGTLYVVSFHRTEEHIDLKANKKLLGKVRIVSKTSDGNSYNVQSKLSDEDLRDFLMEEYHLDKGQVVVAVG